MYHGHYAFALLLKAFYPESEAAPLVWGASLLDILGGAGVLMGVTDLEPTKDITASSYIYTDFRNIDITHSLVTSTALAVLAGAIFYYRLGYSAKSSVLAVVSSVGHWCFDSIVIKRKLALFPSSDIYFGRGMYTKFPYGSWAAEALFCLLVGLFAQSVYRSRKSDISGVLAILAVQTIAFSPWASIMQYLPGLPYARYINGLLFIVGYAIPSYFWVQLLNRADRSAKSNSSKGR